MSNKEKTIEQFETHPRRPILGEELEVLPWTPGSRFVRVFLTGGHPEEQAIVLNDGDALGLVIPAGTGDLELSGLERVTYRGDHTDQDTRGFSHSYRLVFVDHPNRNWHPLTEFAGKGYKFIVAELAEDRLCNQVRLADSVDSSAGKVIH